MLKRLFERLLVLVPTRLLVCSHELFWCSRSCSGVRVGVRIFSFLLGLGNAQVFSALRKPIISVLIACRCYVKLGDPARDPGYGMMEPRTTDAPVDFKSELLYIFEPWTQEMTSGASHVLKTKAYINLGLRGCVAV